MLELEPKSFMEDFGPVLRHSSEEPSQETAAALMNDPVRSDPADVSPRSKRRPSATSAHSSQKSKKRVVWKGKACAISFPLDDKRGQRPLLSSDEVVARIKQWQSEGWNTCGFQISSSPTKGESASQSCRQYPDPVDVIHERQSGGFRVRVPNRVDWDIYVNFLKEEKLRALGVTSSEGDNSESARSPFTSSISRSSSRIPGQSLLPPIPPSSGASNFPSSNSHSFSPNFPTSNGSSRIGSVAPFPPQPTASQNNVHRSSVSVAYPAMNLRMTSPFNSHPLRPSLPLRREPSPSAYLVQHSDRLLHSTAGAVQNFSQPLSPGSPFEKEMSAGQSNGVTAETFRQVNPQSQLDPLSQHRRNYTQTRPCSHFSAPSTRQGHEQEIAHPAPQGHQRNISEALQKEIDAAEEAAQTDAIIADLQVQATRLNGLGKPPDILQSSAPQRQINGIDKNDPRNSEYAPTQPNGTKGHKPSASGSKLNVEAQEYKFNPKAQFSSLNFLYGKDPSQHFLYSAVPSYGHKIQPEAVLSRTTTIAKLNADAPSFTPSTFGKSDFQFHSATFNVGAPEFNPGLVESRTAEDSAIDARSACSTEKIFTDVTIDSTRDTTRRGKVSKALPIRPPDDSEHTEDDEDGRVRVSAARQKRARVHRANGDDVPVFAKDMPLQSAREEKLLSEITPISPVPVTAGHEHARQRAMIDPSAKTPSTMVEEEGNSPAGPSFEEMHIQGTNSASSPESDSMLTRAEKVSSAQPSPGESGNRGAISTDGKDGLEQSPCHDSMASLSTLFLGNGGVHKSSGSFSSTSKPQKSISQEPSHYVPTPPSSPSAATVPEDSSPQRLAAGRPLTRSSPEVTEINMSNGSSGGAFVENAGVRSQHTAPAATIDDAVHAAPSANTVSHVTSSSDEQDRTVPSYDEIDAVMKQFEDNPDLGVERHITPPVPSGHAGLPLLDPSINIRSDAPSPSPRRTQLNAAPVPRSGQIRKLVGKSLFGTGIDPEGVGTNGVEDADVSDWNDVISVVDEYKFESRAQFLDSHVNSIVGSILEDRLEPLERRLETIQHSIGLVATQHRSNRRRTSTSDEMKHSDADDEDDETESKSVMAHRTRTPLSQKKDCHCDVIRTVVMEALTSQKQESPAVDRLAFEQLLSEVRSLREASISHQRPDEMKAIVEDVISTHPRLRGKRVQEDHQAGASHKFSLQIDGLESMLKIANERVEEEYRARRKVEDNLAETDRRLNLVAEEAAQYREASEEAERSLRTYYEQQESFQDLEQSLSEQHLKTAALETTLEEYRLSHDQWRIDMEDERRRRDNLKGVLHSLRREIEESSQTKQSLRAKLDRVQDDMTDVMESVAHDQASWLRKEQEISSEADAMQAELLRETRMRQKLEIELDDLDKEHKEVLKTRDAYEVVQKENTRLEVLLAQTRQESRAHEDAAHRLEQEINDLRGKAEAEVSRAHSTHAHDIAILKSQHGSVNTDRESQISRLQAQLQQAEDDADESQVRHQNHVDDLVDRHGRTLHEVNETKEAALEEQRRSHERALNDLRERHARALHNASDDKHRLEAHFTEKLALGSDKIQHLEEKVTDLQDRLEITSSAARAAAIAAAGKAPAEPNVRSVLPLSSASTASMPIARDSNTPEKISPQALRESIMVLQDQLQYREQKIEALEAELGKVDKDAPSKIKDRDSEISWLRELLGVRIDDLEAIIHALSKADFDRQVVKDAVIRLKANLQMEQQERERAAAGGSNVFPSMSSLSSLTQSPRALPMAAAAAWGNWRRARDLPVGNLSDHANTHANNQTPSRSSASPQSFLSGLLTPPSASQRQPSPAPNAPPTLMSLNGRKSSSEARPLRGYSQAPNMSGRQTEKRPLRGPPSSDHPQPAHRQQRRQERPSTPPLMRESSYDRDADARKSIISDVDGDASLVGSGMEGGGSSLGEPMDESTQ